MRAGEFVARTLGSLASADPELRATLRTYIRARFSASRAARALFAHRNTVLNRIQRAEQLLPLDLHDHSLEIGVALEIEHWLGPQVTSRPKPRKGSYAARGTEASARTGTDVTQRSLNAADTCSR